MELERANGSVGEGVEAEATEPAPPHPAVGHALAWILEQDLGHWRWLLEAMAIDDPEAISAPSEAAILALATLDAIEKAEVEPTEVEILGLAWLMIQKGEGMLW